MATTFYSSVYQDYRVRCDYTVSSATTTTTVSGTIYLQHKGANDETLFEMEGGVGLNSSKGSDYPIDVWTESVRASKHTSWTNVRSKSFSFSASRSASAQTYYLSVGMTRLIGASGVVEKAITIPALPTYTITYNANGRGSVPSAGKKTHGTTYHISASTPTASGYKFKTWNTKADGTGTDYTPSQAYTTNANLTLYAQWQPIPKISSITAIRCNAQGEDDSSGEYALVACQWSIASGTATLIGTIAPEGETATAFSFSSGSTGTGGTATALISSTNGLSVDIDTQYVISVTATNNAYSSANTTVSEILTKAYFVMDWKAGGRAIGIGVAAPNSGLEIGYETVFDDDVSVLGDLTVNNHSSPIGTVKNAWLSSAKSVSNATGTPLCYISLEEGTWIVNCGVRFPTNATGYRRANISETNGSTDVQIQVPPTSGEWTQLVFTKIIKVNSTATYYLNAQHNAGTALTMPASGEGYGSYIRAIRIL